MYATIHMHAMSIGFEQSWLEESAQRDEWRLFRVKVVKVKPLKTRDRCQKPQFF